MRNAGTQASKSFSDNFKVAAGAVGVIGTAIAGIGLKAAIDWESAFTGVEKTVDATDEELKQLEGTLRAMAGPLGTSAVELAGLAEQAGALGIRTPDIAEFVRISAMLGVTTDVSAGMAATALGKINSVIPLTSEEMGRFASTLVDLGNKGASTESQIIDMAQNMAGAASVVGMSIPQMLGWAAAAANVGIEAEAGSSSFQRLALGVQEFVVQGGPKLAEIARLTGMTGDEFKELFSRDASAAMQAIIGGLAEMDGNTRAATLAALGFTDIRLTKYLLTLSANQDNLNQSLANGATGWQENTAAGDEFAKRTEDTAFQIEALKADLTETAIIIGEALLPHVKNLVSFLRDAAQAVGNWMRENKGLVDTLTPILAVLSGILALKWGGNFLGSLLGQLGLRGLGQLLIKAIIPSATIAGTAAGGAQATAHATAATGPGLITRMVAALMKTAPFTIAASALGTAIGAAQAAAHSAAATGASAVSGLVAKVAAMSIPMAAAGTTVGTAAGSAMAAGVTAGWLVAIGAGAGAAIFGPRLLLEKLTGNDEEGKLRGQTMAYAVSEGFSAAAGSGAGDAMVAAVVAAIAAGKTREESYLAGEAAALAFLDGWVEPWAGGADNTSGRDAFDRYMADLANIAAQGGTEAGTAAATTWVASAVRVLAGEGKAHMLSAGRDLTEALAAGTTSAESTRWMIAAADTLAAILTNHLDPKEQALELIGKNYTKLVAEGVRSGIPDAVTAAQAMAIQAINTIENAGLTGAKGQKGLKAIGLYYDSLLASGMTEGEARLALAAGGVAQATIDKFSNKPRTDQADAAGGKVADVYVGGIADLLHSEASDRRIADAAKDAAGGFNINATADGQAVASSFIGGIASFLRSEVAERRVHDAAREATAGIRGDSPPKVGPLRFIDKWGENIGAAWLDGVKKGIGGVGPLLTAGGRMPFNIGSFSGTGTINLHHTVDIKGDSGNLDNRKVADYLNEGAAGFAWNLEHAMSAVTSG